MSIPGALTVIGTVPAFAGGTIIAKFQSQGGGRPAIARTVGAQIGSTGAFTLPNVWDNSHALHTPSVTIFIIQSADGSVAYTGPSQFVNSNNQDISAAFAAAPAPRSSIGTVAITNNPSGSGKILTSTSATAAAWS